ncbi:MAG: hypothetical protein ACHQ7M_10655 [Chloroflexota bacterium]
MIDATKLPDIPEERRGAKRTMAAEVESLGKQLKVGRFGRFRHFEFYCDEPPTLGGEDQHPQPLTYLAAGVGF